MIGLVSTIILVLFLPIPFVLLFMHLFIGFWRRVGKSSYIFAVAFWPVLGISSIIFRQELFLFSIPRILYLQITGLILFLFGIWLSARSQKHLTLPVLVGVPEILPEKHKQRLVTTGVYARLRHPRYVSYFLILDGWFLASGYVIFPVIALLLLAIIPIEERELIRRFSHAYDVYRKNVPAFFPRLKPWSHSKQS